MAEPVSGIANLISSGRRTFSGHFEPTTGETRLFLEELEPFSGSLPLNFRVTF